jgi:hypothetical protein
MEEATITCQFRNDNGIFFGQSRKCIAPIMRIIVVGSYLMYRIYLNDIDRQDKLLDKTLAYIPILR